MCIRKLISGTMGFALAAVLLASPAFACGGHHSGRHSQTSRAVYLCPIEDCEADGRHIHNGVTYCGYTHASGLCDGKCAALCSVEDCQIAGRHTHDDIICCGYAHTSGFCDGTCVALCTVEDCQVNGRHTHDGATYCGDAHDGCFCDGTCVNAASNTTGGCHQRRRGHC